MKLLTTILLLLVLPAGVVQAEQAFSTPTGSGSSTLGYECSDEEDGRWCVCVGLIDCMRMRDSGVCTHQSGPLEGTDDFECDDVFDACTCTWPRESQSVLRQPERTDSGERLAPGSGKSRSPRSRPFAAGTAAGDRLVASQPIMTAPGQPSETVSARRGQGARSEVENREIEAMESEREAMERELREREDAGSSGSASGSEGTPGTANFDPVSPITDPIEDAFAPAGNVIGDAIENIEDRLGDLLGGSSSDEDARESTVDHRTGRTPPGRNETVSARRGQLPAPSDLLLSVETPSSIEISWQDNARSEHGVHVERGTPVREPGGVSYDWRRIFSSEERVESQVTSTGTRSDIDDGLVPGTLYCYRLQAYRADQVSTYSEIACATVR